MLEVNFTPFPVLNTERLTLRPVSLDDAKELFFLRSDESVMKYIDRPRAKTAEDIFLFVEKVNNNLANNDGILWGITIKDDPTLIGSIGFHYLMKENYRAEIGYVMHPSQHGKGIMQEAARAVLDHGFNIMGLHSVEAHINPENAASAKMLERIGFVREAYFKENYFWDGRFLDSVVYSLIKQD